MKNRQNKILHYAAFFVAAACMITIVISIIILIGRQSKEKTQEEYYSSLAKDTFTAIEKEESEEEKAEDGTTEKAEPVEEKESAYQESIKTLTQMGIPIPEKQVDFQMLQEEINPDIYAWIYIPGSAIDYPILQHEYDNSYYLNHNIDGSEGYPGCIYTENYNDKDFSDPVTVIYGHNMNDGTMFAGLHRFEDKKYFDETVYIYIYTPEKLLVYEVFSAFLADDAHILLNNNFYDEENLQRYIDIGKNIKIMNVNNREGIDVTYKNHILTLSTCGATSANRYLVQGVLLNED